MIVTEWLQSSLVIPKVERSPLKLLKEEVIWLRITTTFTSFKKSECWFVSKLFYTRNGNYRIKQLVDHTNMAFFTQTLRLKSFYLWMIHISKIQKEYIDTVVHHRVISCISIHRRLKSVRQCTARNPLTYCGASLSGVRDLW